MLPWADEWDNESSEVVQLIIPFFRRKSNKLVLSIGEPFPEKPPKAPVIPKNIVAEALKFQSFLNEEPFRQNEGGSVLRRTRTYEEVARHFDVSCARVSQLMSILRNLPESFLDSMKDSSDPNVLTIFSGRQLIRISRLATLERREKAISRLKDRKAFISRLETNC
ncbi:MAG: hypothetical protein COV74_04905 [Candidatus Omnitrophica bacterium CG11_big_fil_rev_8_21_14_0_20_45_26]|uniref:Uncharacterized protein n=1 Tax=Candidatus Abzuiibacterium crystallinum TaxID=1974748 RepID=A0A2H0LPX1_9BACT|nr:MAG: hypothetical protein COV74_04905 [Candidatus Omnitrophica bacterium CG11_big_fil_rev_8_21_14_0_20_45_26]PIW63600.1 MAG: hypothetical protein COW12_09820 [Candidatus Omnitrophica bacterium CG12_big_fil_rev_8_21_14_0_65_45_16]